MGGSQAGEIGGGEPCERRFIVVRVGLVVHLGGVVGVACVARDNLSDLCLTSTAHHSTF